MNQKLKISINEIESEMERFFNSMSEAWVRRDALRHMPTAVEFDGVDSLVILDWVVDECWAEVERLHSRLQELPAAPNWPSQPKETPWKHTR